MKHRKRLGNKGGVFEWIVVLVVIFGCAVIWMGTYGLIHSFMPNVLSTLHINAEQYGLQYISTVYDMMFPAIILLSIVWAFTSPERIDGGMSQL
jgi:hypothetical protein